MIDEEPARSGGVALGPMSSIQVVRRTPHGGCLCPVNDYEPSPSERVRDQVARYEATDGAAGGTLEGKPVVILTSTGARSGKIHGAEKDRWWVVAESFWPHFPAYRANAGREIPIFLLEPLESL
jgi:hypothetical protein